MSGEPGKTHTILIEWLGTNCPVQADGTIDGKKFYFRGRHDKWSLRVGGEDVVVSPEWKYEEIYPGDAGWILLDEAVAFIQKAAALYLERAG